MRAQQGLAMSWPGAARNRPQVQRSMTCSEHAPHRHTARRVRCAPRASRAAVPSSASTTAPPVLVVGAGIGGLATAVALAKVGVPVRVLEAGPGLRQEGAAIGLWANAWRALDALGVADALRPEHLELSRVELCRDNGQLLKAFGFQPPPPSSAGPPAAAAAAAAGAAAVAAARSSNEFRGVRRATLLQALYDALPSAEHCVSFGTPVEEVISERAAAAGPSSSTSNSSSGSVAVRLRSGEVVYGSALVGADGVRSVVARHLQLATPRYAGYVAYRGVAQFSGTAPVPLDTIRQIWGAGVRAGLYPLSPTSCYWYTCFNAPEAEAVPPKDALARQVAAAAAVRGWSWSMEDVIMATPPEDVTYSRIVDRWTAGSFGRGCVTLAGDAAHPMTPNLGQGGCCALEDAVVLARVLKQALAAAGGTGGQQQQQQPQATEAALRSYEAERSRRCLPLTIRSNLMGLLLQIPLAPVCFVRDTFVRTAFDSSHFLDHTRYDPGTL